MYQELASSTPGLRSPNSKLQYLSISGYSGAPLLPTNKKQRTEPLYLSRTSTLAVHRFTGSNPLTFVFVRSNPGKLAYKVLMNYES